MANPQKENGHTQISNELFEAILRSDFSLRELKIIFCVIRFTYGFSRKAAELSSRFISNATSIKPNHIFTTIKDLINKNVLLNLTSKVGSTRKYQLNKDYDMWLSKSQNSISHETVLSTKKVLFISPETVLESSPVKVTKKENNKKNSKENINEELFIHPLQLFISENCKNVSQLKQQLTNADCLKILLEYPESTIKEKLFDMENYSKLKNYTSVKLTLNKWLKRTNSQEKNNGSQAKQNNFNIIRFAKGDSSVSEVERIIRNSQKENLA